MPRLQIEDSFWFDPRFKSLSRKIGEDLAIGKCVRAFRTAQTYWIDNEQPIPHDVWDHNDTDELLEFNLAEKVDSGVYIKGSKKHFAWLVQRKEAGRKGGLASADAKVKQSQAPLKQTQAPLERCSSKSNPIPIPIPIPNKNITPRFTETDLDLATRWLGVLFSGKGKVNKERAAETLRQCREIDGFSQEDLERIFEFVQQSDFWSKNAQSPAGLRTKSKTYPDLTKLQVISSQMQKQGWQSDEQKRAAYEAEAEALYGPLLGANHHD